ncbi:MAG: hypothetical protein AB8G95_06375 [Anaerolineae bacterium]
MSEFEMEQNELDNRLDAMLDQLGPDPLPAGFTSRTMAAIRLEPKPVVAPEPFRLLNWLDFVPALAASIAGIILLLIWSGTAGDMFSFISFDNLALFGSTNDFQIAALFSVIGLAVAAVPLLMGNSRSRNSLFLLALN